MKFGFSKVQTKKRFKLLAYYLIFSIVFQLVAPNYSFALTSGPAQEEYASFEPVGTNQMVDLYSGDFTYNIPLLSVPGPNGGYPINLAYHSGVGMEQEASWVGLGWNINMGAINRQLRGLPDDFNGDVVTESVHMKENITVGFNDVLKWLPNRSRSETAGFPDPENEEMGLTMMGDPSSYETNSYRLGLFYNNYKGFGYEYSLGLKGKRFRHITKLKFGLNLNFNSQNGITYSPSVEHGYSINGNKEISASINSRTGFQNLRISRGIGRNRTARVFKLGNTSSLSFGYMPNNVASIQYTYNRQNVPFKFDFGNKSIAKVEYPFPVSGEINISSLGPNGDAVFNRSAYGYLNTEKSEEEDITDFSESQNIRYSKLVPNLAPSTVNYDIYSMTGQGTGGMFRPHKSEIGIYNQQNQTEVNPIANDGSNITGIEIGSSTLPNDFHLGFDTQFGNTTNYSGKWEEENEVNDHLGLNENKDPRKEGTYFQMYGEKTAKYQSENYLNTWSGDDAVSMKLEKTSNYSNRKYQAKGVLKNSAGTETSLSNTLNGKQSKVRRASNIQRLTKSQVQSYGISNYLAYSVDNTPSVNDVNSVNSNVAKSSDLSNVGTNDHINEISVLQSNGMKYVYGLPAYNKTRIDAAFRLPIDQDVLQNGYRITEEDPYPIQKMSRVKNWYANGEIKREGGALDEFVSKTTTPAYAHSWLLTSVLSDDYVDITGDGPTNDDFGYWTKFNYKKVIENYKWRTPYSDANFSSGSFASQRDNIGSYTYGEKDIFYIETVETKTHIAVFELENREDGYEAKGELVDEDESNIHGTNSLKALKSIKLYSKNEYLANPANAIPVKEVHFEYDYSLCPGVPNNINGGGKLTLKKVYFTYEGSNRMEYSPYEFTYSNNNPAYSYQDMDRWGLYKNNSIYQNHYPSGRFPYVDQESPSAVDNWLMTDIKLPSGSNMHVDYEQDSYSFVEGKRPMEMMDIIGINKYANIVPVDGGKHDPSATVAFTPLKGDYVYIKLRESVATREEFSEKYLNKEGLKYVHFRAEVSLSNNLITNDENRKYELINGFGEIDYGSEDSNENPDDYGIVANGTIGYIKLKKLNLGKLGAIKTNPIRKAALQHLNINVPHIKYGEPTQNVTVNIQSLFSPLQDMLGTVLGKYKADIVEGRAEFIRLTGHSQIRMYSPTEKLGGGVRVKQIYVEDDGASGFASQRYGQVYTYEDGVAYEPQIGMEESSLIQPVNYNSKWFNDNNMGGANQFFVKKPVMQDYYPGQSVGYGKVTVQSINTNDYFTSTTDYNHKSITPTVEHEFYTPKDFPVYTDETDLGEHDAIRRVIPLLGLYNKNVKRVARSQGYSIVLNDMAGKPKLTRTIAEKPKNATNGEDKILSSQEYRYQTKSQFNTNGNNRLNNEVTCLNSDGSQVKAVIGETVEIFNVMNENYSKTNSGGLEFNVGVMPSGSLPMLQYITPIPAVTQSEASFKTSVTHKIIHRSGVLKEVEVWDGKSRVVTENLAYDGETGAVINSKVTNEYEDPLYSFNYPAHWNYEALGGAYKNLGSKLNSDHFNTAINNGVLQVNAGYEDLFTPGDELFVSHSNGSDRIHVLEVNGTDLTCIDTNGDFYDVDDIEELTIINSGYENLQSASTGNIVSDAENLFSGLPEIFVQLNNEWDELDENQHPASISHYFNEYSGESCQSGFNNMVWLIDDGCSSDGLRIHCTPEGQSNGSDGSVAITGSPLGSIPTFTQYEDYECIGFNYLSKILKIRHTHNVTGIVTDFELQIDFPEGSCIELCPPKVLQASAVEFSDNWKVNCGNGVDCGVNPDNGVNPYKVGLKGIWRPYKSYTYITERENNEDTRKDGFFKDFEFFNWQDLTQNSEKWQMVNEITKYSPYGFEIENKDALGIYSAAYYGYGKSLVTAVGANTKYNEMLYDGFEDYDLQDSCSDNHWKFNDVGRITNEESHTGDYSYKHISGAAPYTITAQLPIGNCDPTDPNYRTGANGIELDDCGCNGMFSPEQNKQYRISFWVKQENNTNFLFDDAKVIVKTDVGTNQVFSVTPGTKVIEGWQRVTGVFTVDAGAQSVDIKFSNYATANQTVYYDDFRIHPFKSNMSSYVYDIGKLKVRATLDANNYATYYIYDDEGQLIQTKIETIDGIKTVSEGKTKNVIND